MQYKDAVNHFILGGAVKYNGKLYAVVGMNEINQTFTIQRLNQSETIPDIKAGDLDG